METQSVAFTKSAFDVARTISIDHLGIGSTDFEIDTATKNKLIQSGWDATLAFLQQQGMNINEWGMPTLVDENEGTVQ
jgi:hypothetical protein